MTQTNSDTQATLEHLFRHEYGKIVAHLTRVYGTKNLEFIEDAVQEALIKAMQNWGFKNVPDNPSGWIFRVARNQLIDVLRRHEKTQYDSPEGNSLFDANNNSFMQDIVLDSELKDDQLRMIFACCHPTLSTESQVILTLKLVGGFGREEIASALLKKSDAVAKSFTRARNKLKLEVKTLEVPVGEALEPRLNAVLKVLYLLFNEGYSSSSGDALVKQDICEEAIRLSFLLLENKHCEIPQAKALLALMLFHSARFATRTDASGEFLSLEEQDRSQWNRGLILKANKMLAEAANGPIISEFHLQAGLAHFHCAAPSFEATNWPAILGLYDRQMQLYPSPVAALNRIVALGRVHGPHAALKALEALDEVKALQHYHLYYAIKSELFAEVKAEKQAIENLELAIDLAKNEVDRRHMERKLMRLKG